MTTPAHNEHKMPDGMIFRLVGNDLLVKMDPPKETTKGGIIIPETVSDRPDEGVLATGTVVAFGYHTFGGKYVMGEWVPLQTIPLPEMKIGLRVVFVRYYAEQHTNIKIREMVGDDIFRMKPLDIMLAFDKEDEDRVLR